jgi:aspartyl-tRNA(Asn)/glutamyl-tRNA(Gln) amidotransferase subunit A
MDIKEFKDFSLEDYQKLIKNREISVKELAQLFLQRIENVDPYLHAFLFVNRESILDEAQSLDEQLEKANPEEIPPLFGIPIAIKDNICTQNIPTTCASKILEGFIPPYDATVVSRLKAQGALILGKTNMDEFAMGSSTENSAFGPTRNPFDLNRVPGGSSGGSSACVSALEAPVSLGSDTGGSIRQPAAFCGVVGLRPTYGRVSRFGLVSFASSLDQIGPITRTVKDCVTIFEVISGKDEKDSTCAPYPAFQAQEIPSREEVKKLKVGLPREYFSEGVDSEIIESIQNTIDFLEKEGIKLVEVSLPHTVYALEAYYIVAPSEASSNLARYDGVLYGFRAQEAAELQEMYFKTRTQGFGKEVKRRIILGTYSLSSGYYDEFYLKGMKVRTLVRQDFEKAFEVCDLLLTPVSPCLPFLFGERTQDPYQMYLADVFTIPSAMAGIPALSINCGYARSLPVGLQIIGRPFQEGLLFGLGLLIEEGLALGAPFPEIPVRKENTYE